MAIQILMRLPCNSYAIGTVTVNASLEAEAGGLVGYNLGYISKCFAIGHIADSGTRTYAGGLVGLNNAPINLASYWNTTSGGSKASGEGTSTGATGLDSASMLQSTSFGNFDFTNTWYQYEGYTYPLLRSFLDSLTITAKDTTKIYDGNSFSGDNGFNYSLPGAAALVFGTSIDTGSSQGAKYPGNNYKIKPSGLWSTQQGYLITYAVGTLTISPRPISLIGITANKTYDGTTSTILTGTADIDHSTVVNLDDVSLAGVASATTYTDKNVGTHKDLTIAGLSLAGADNGYYKLETTIHTASITPRPITISGVTAADKVYDGTMAAALSIGTLDAITGDDVTLNVGTGAFVDANVGTAKTATASGYSIAGNDASNYTLGAQPTGLAANITPKTIHIAANTNTIAFGAASPTLTYVADSLLAGDSLTGALTREVGDTAGTYAILIGTLSAGGNYTIDFTSANVVITAPESIRTNAPSVAFTGRTSAKIFNLQGKQVWSGSLDVINGQVKMPSIGEGRWVVKLQKGTTKQQ